MIRNKLAAIINELRIKKNKLLYDFNGGYKCECCGALIPIHWNIIVSSVNGKVIFIRNHSDHLYCASCIYDKTVSHFKHISHYIHCSYCPTDTKSIGHLYGFLHTMPGHRLGIDLRFGDFCWRHVNVGQTALDIALHSSDLRYVCDDIKIKNDKLYYTDRNGIVMETKLPERR